MQYVNNMALEGQKEEKRVTCKNEQMKVQGLKIKKVNLDYH